MTDLEPDLDYSPPVRMLPQDPVAEQSVLGGLMLSRDAREDVIGGRILDVDDFYLPVHQMVYEAVVALHSRGEPADAVTVAGELGRRGELKRVGGHIALHGLIEATPTAANASYYARLVREKAVLRRLVQAGMKVTQLGYAAEGGDADSLVGAALKELEAVGSVGRAQVDEPLADSVASLMSALVDGEEDPTEQFYWPYYDMRDLLGGARPGQLVIVAARPGAGKTTLLLDLARCFAIEQGLSVDLWSREMPKSENIERLVAAEAGVLLHEIRERKVRESAIPRLWDANARIADANLRIYDDDGSLNDIAASARKHKTRVVLYDYVQLAPMPSHVRTPEQRRLELGNFSRGGKHLAKAEDVLFVVAAQLNRGPEQRTDKRPMVSDLRECLVGDTLVTRADTGARVPIRDLVGGAPVPVWGLDPSLKTVPAVMTDVWRVGTRETYRVHLKSGRSITATAGHPLRTVHGWTPVADLSAGTGVAIPCRVPEPVAVQPWPEHELVLLAHMLGDGCLTEQSFYYCSADSQNVSVVVDAVHQMGARTRLEAGRGVTYVYMPMEGRPSRNSKNPVREWAKALGVFGARAWEKDIPAEIHSLPDEQIRLFLRHLWATDGALNLIHGSRASIYYATSSRALARSVQALLLRVGIVGRISKPSLGNGRPSWHVRVSGQDDQARFLTEVGVHGRRGEKAAQVLAVIRGQQANPNVGAVPAAAWSTVREAASQCGITGRALADRLGMSYCGTALYKTGISRGRMARLAAVVEDQRLIDLAESDVFWDEVLSVEPAGQADVYDASVPGPNSFLADDIWVHNCGDLEQDADLVLLLHREDMYEPEGPRAGEVDIIAGKHRNGKTGTITVANQLHIARFKDIFSGEEPPS